MQLSNIALATILITMFATGPVTSSSSFSSARAMFAKLEAEAAKEPRSGPKGKQPSAEPKPATTFTKAKGPPVRSYPPSSEGAKGTWGKPEQPPTKKPTAASPPKQPSPPKVPPAPKQTTTSSQPAPGRSEPAPLFLRPGEAPKTPEQLRQQQQQTSQGSNVTGLKSMWGPASSSQPASPLKPSPPSSTSSKPSISTLDPQAERFKAKMQEWKFSDAWYVYNEANDESRRQCREYLVSLGYGKLIRTIEGIYNPPSKLAILGIVLAHTNQDFDKILDNFDLDDCSFWDVRRISNVDLACNSDNFIAVIEKITDKDKQQSVIKEGVLALFDKDKTGCLDPLISALESKASDPNLANVAIQQAFLRACEYKCTDHRSSFAKLFHDHHAISAENYSDALYRAYLRGKPDYDYELFNWLIERADLDDLNVFMSNGYFYLLPREFGTALQEYVQNPRVLKTISKKRSERRRSEEIERALEGYVAKDLISMINAYDIVN